MGIHDDGNVIGISEEDIQESLEFLNKQIYESCSPPIIPQIYTLIHKGKHLLIIEVSGGMNKPYFISKKGMDNGTYVRIGRSTMKASPEMLQELQWQSRGLSYDTLPCYPSSLEDLDSERLAVFLKYFETDDQKQSERILRSHSLLVQEHGKNYLTHAASLLFGVAPQSYHPEAFIIATRFKGTEGREALDARDFMGSLTSQIQSALSFIIGHIGVRYSIKGSQREEWPTIPEIAIREAVTNAVVHRNYHMPSPIKIAVYENRVEIFSPGGFPLPISERDFPMGISHIRNTLIAKIMRQMGYVEKLGSGLMTIVDSCLREGLVRPAIIDGGSFTKVILYKTEGDSPIVKTDLDKVSNEILQQIEIHEERSAREIIQVLGMAKTTVIRKLNLLCDLGLIQKTGKARSVRYHHHRNH